MHEFIAPVNTTTTRVGASGSAQLSLLPEGNRPYAYFSDCGLYRYFLAWPTGRPNDRAALGCFANPSKATAEQTDPTVERWLNYCFRWGYGWAWVVNARAWRETDPKLVPPDPEAIGPETDAFISAAAAQAELVVCGWGKLGGERGAAAQDLIHRAGNVPHALHLNDDGSPGHPLYLPGTAKPFPMELTGG